MSDSGIPQWKSWYRWPFLLPFLMGAAMLVVGVRECLMLAEALRTLPPTIVVNTAMSAFPPLGIGIMAAGLLGWLPRKADGSGLRPIRTRRGGERGDGGSALGAWLYRHDRAGQRLVRLSDDTMDPVGPTCRNVDV